MKKTALMVIICLLLACVVPFLLLMGWVSYTPQLVTTDISDYGTFKGNYDNKSVNSYITSFFPKSISEEFENISYSYRAQKGDAYAYEAYLSFSITDKEKFEDFINSHIAGLEAKPFFYDSAYVEYTIDDIFVPEKDSNTSSTHIQYAKIGKILCNFKENKVVFIALGVYDGGLVETEFLSVYFNHFQIDPGEYSTRQGTREPSPCLTGNWGKSKTIVTNHNM